MALSRKELARRRGLGAQRAEVAHLIKYEMRKRGYTGETFAEKLKCSGANVSKTVNGLSHSELVLNGLRDIGLSPALLFDPHATGQEGV